MRFSKFVIAALCIINNVFFINAANFNSPKKPSNYYDSSSTALHFSSKSLKKNQKSASQIRAINKALRKSLHQPKILLCCTSKYIFSGAFLYRINLYKILKKNGYPVLILAGRPMCNHDFLEKHCIKGSHVRRALSSTTNRIFRAMYEICKKEKISIIHTNTNEELLAAKKVAELLHVSVVHSVLAYFSLEQKADLGVATCDVLRGADCVIAVNPDLAYLVSNANKKNNLNIKHIAWIPPFIEEKRFLNYQPSLTKNEFFQQFNVVIKDGLPVITVVANFYQCKNHELLLRALAKLINERKRPVQVMLAGKGASESLKELAKSLNIDQYVNFLGFINDTPSLFYFSDIKLLPSYRESFAMVLLEAGLMKKPLIGSRGTGMECTISHEQTGLLINPYDVDDIVAKIEQYLDHPKLAQQMGENAFNFIKTNYSTDVIFKKLVEVYNIALANKGCNQKGTL